MALLDFGITFKSMLNLDNGLIFKFFLVCSRLIGGFSLSDNWHIWHHLYMNANSVLNLG